MATSPASAQGHAASRTPLNATERTARLLGLIPWVAERGSASLAELEARFDYPRELLLADLAAVAVGDDEHSGHGWSESAFSHVVALEQSMEDDHLHVHCPRWLSDPIRLNCDEAARLLAVGTAALSMEIHSDDAQDSEATSLLLRALTKLQLMLDDTRRGLNTRADYADRGRWTRLDANTDSSITVQLGDAPESTLDDLRCAVSQRRRVEIEYYSYARDELTARVVDPYLVFSQQGAWYFSGWCHRARDERVFRVDRLRCLRVTEADAATTPDIEHLPTFNPENCDRVVTLRLDMQARWVIECYPIQECTMIEDGRLEIKLAVSMLPWLARLLLQLGPHVEVVTDDPEIAALRSSVASDVLKRYR